MADINKLKDKIKSTIYPNGKGAINASDHQAMLLEMADGMAETDTKLATLSARVDGIENGDSSVTPDWNAQEGETGYIKNKPFGLTGGEWKELHGGPDDMPVEIIAYNWDESLWIEGLGQNPYMVVSDGTNSVIIKLNNESTVSKPFGQYTLELAGGILQLFGDTSEAFSIHYYVTDTIVPLDEAYIPDTIVRESDLEGLSEGIALRNVGAEDTDESVDEPEIPTPSVSNEWKCVFDGRMEVGANNMMVSTFADGSPLKASELIVQILLDQQSTVVTQGYVAVNSTSNTQQSYYGPLFFERETEPYGLSQVKMKASPMYMVAEVTAGLINKVAQGVDVAARLGSTIPQIYEDFTMVRVFTNTPIAECPPLINIYAR